MSNNLTYTNLFRMLGCVAVTVLFSFLLFTKASAEISFSESQQLDLPTSADLIEAVNNLRVSQGLNALAVHPILMQTAQMQAAALLASDGAVGHARPGGINITDQLLLLGYPLAGDLSLGGYRAENWISVYPGMTVEAAIEMWMGDGPHTNTMLSSYYMDIGAGVAFNSDGSGFFVIDCARPTASGKPQAYTPAPGLGSAGALDMSQYVQPVELATARPDGDVIHVVGYGQSLWSIAMAYGTRIDEIRRLNNITDLTIYTGQKLLVLKGATQPPPPPAETVAVTPSPRPTRGPSTTPVSMAIALENTSSTNQNLPVSQENSQSFLTTMVFGLLILAVVLGGLITWLTTPKTTE
jgi:uncharacterized protein YkwD/LysM repeat protein